MAHGSMAAQICIACQTNIRDFRAPSQTNSQMSLLRDSTHCEQRCSSTPLMPLVHTWCKTISQHQLRAWQVPILNTMWLSHDLLHHNSQMSHLRASSC